MSLDHRLSIERGLHAPETHVELQSVDFRRCEVGDLEFNEAKSRQPLIEFEERVGREHAAVHIDVLVVTFDLPTKVQSSHIRILNVRSDHIAIVRRSGPYRGRVDFAADFL